jgi:hypothetical protein
MDVLQLYRKHEDCSTHSLGVLSPMAAQYSILQSCSETKSHLLPSYSAKEVLTMVVDSMHPLKDGPHMAPIELMLLSPRAEPLIDLLAPSLIDL